MPLYMKMSQNINEKTRHLKFRYISIFLEIFYGLYMCVFITCVSESSHQELSEYIKSLLDKEP